MEMIPARACSAAIEVVADAVGDSYLRHDDTLMTVGTRFANVWLRLSVQNITIAARTGVKSATRESVLAEAPSGE